MSSRIDESSRHVAPALAQELAKLTAVVVRWGMEAGFLGIDGQLDGRLPALVKEASLRLFGNCDAERDRLLSQIEGAEREQEESARRLQELRDRLQVMRLGWCTRLRLWWQDLAGTRADRRMHRAQDPELRGRRLKFEMVELTRREACEWREMAMQSLRASFEYHQTRAALVRPEHVRPEK